MVGRRKKRMAGRVSDLSDSYVRSTIRQQYGVSSSNIPGVLIEVKRNLIKLKRLRTDIKAVEHSREAITP